MRSARGSFTLSLDCEGLWGIADNRTIISKGLINDESLKIAYDYLFSVLGKYSINATAAFVSAFAVDSSVLYDHMELIKHLAKLNPTWFSSILATLKAGEFEWLERVGLLPVDVRGGYGNRLARSQPFASFRTNI